VNGMTSAPPVVQDSSREVVGLTQTASTPCTVDAYAPDSKKGGVKPFPAAPALKFRLITNANIAAKITKGFFIEHSPQISIDTNDRPTPGSWSSLRYITRTSCFNCDSLLDSPIPMAL
jgi:hypothetical protein